MDAILVVVDRLSKYSHFIPLQHPYSAKDVASLFIQHVVKLHGFPRTIVSDRDSLFMSVFWGELFRQSGTNLHMSIAYHPQSDGQTEVVNRGIETYLRCFVGQQPKLWCKWLAWAEYWFNTTYNRCSGMTPFWALYGRDAPVLLRYLDHTSTVQAIDEQMIERNHILDELKLNLSKAQVAMSNLP